MTCIKAWVSLNFDLIPPLTMELAALNGVKIRCLHFFLAILIHIFLMLADKQNWHNILCLNSGLIAVISSKLPAFEHCKIWCLQTLC